jgi:hypothetical protein
MPGAIVTFVPPNHDQLLSCDPAKAGGGSSGLMTGDAARCELAYLPLIDGPSKPPIVAQVGHFFLRRGGSVILRRC